MSQTDTVESAPYEGDRHPYQYNHKKLVARVLIALTTFLLVVFITLSQLFAWGRVNALSDRVVQLRTQLEQRSSKSDCLALYRNDVSTTLGVAIAANNELWVSVAVRDPNLTPEEQAVDNARLGRLLEEANKPLVAAAQALEDYDKLEPKPEVCPHPGEDTENNG